MKTPMQKFIDWANTIIAVLPSGGAQNQMIIARNKAKQMLEKEKEIIINAYIEGCNDSILSESTDKTIAEQLNVTDFPFEIKDKRGGVIYLEKSDKYWARWEHDSSGIVRYYEDSDGKIIDNRPKKDDIGVNRTERGWAGHYILADRCRFRRNTLLSYKDINIVVSSVGLMVIDGKCEPIGADRYFETMAFHADKNDKRYFDARLSKKVHFESDWSISEVDANDKANEMHEAVVAEISTKLIKGCKFDERESSVT